MIQFVLPWLTFTVLVLALALHSRSTALQLPGQVGKMISPHIRYATYNHVIHTLVYLTPPRLQDIRADARNLRQCIGVRIQPRFVEDVIHKLTHGELF